MGKGEIAHYEQFLLFLQCFQKACFPGVSKGVVVWEWVKRTLWEKEKMLVKGVFSLSQSFCILFFALIQHKQLEPQLTLSQTSPGFLCVFSMFFETLGKGKIARNEQFLLFPRCFLPI